jgi:hypothetical protein
VYDPSTHTVLTPSSESLRVTLPATVSMAKLLAFRDYDGVDNTVLTPANGVLNVPVGPLISILEFRT